MSKIIKHVIETKEKVVGLKCDICEKETFDIEDGNWYGFSHHHNEWGNDSIESYKYFDVCSVECYILQLQKSLEILEEYDSSGSIDSKSVEFVRNMLFKINE